MVAVVNEAQFWSQRVRPAIRHTGHFERVENALSAGTPDVWFQLPDGQSGWIENKYLPRGPARDGTPVFGRRGLRNEQLAWWSQYLNKGGRHGYIMAGVGARTYCVPVTAATLAAFNVMSLWQLDAYRLDPDTWWRRLR